MIGAFRIRASVLMAIRRDVNFAADDWLHAAGGGLMEKIRGREKISMVGHRYRGHFLPRRFGSELANFASAVQQRIVGVQMEMNELGRSHCNFYFNPKNDFWNSATEATFRMILRFLS